MDLSDGLGQWHQTPFTKLFGAQPFIGHSLIDRTQDRTPQKGLCNTCRRGIDRNKRGRPRPWLQPADTDAGMDELDSGHGPAGLAKRANSGPFRKSVTLRVLEMDETQQRQTAVILRLDDKHAPRPKHHPATTYRKLHLGEFAGHHISHPPTTGFIFITQRKMQKKIFPSGKPESRETRRKIRLGPDRHR